MMENIVHQDGILFMFYHNYNHLQIHVNGSGPQEISIWNQKVLWFSLYSFVFTCSSVLFFSSSIKEVYFPSLFCLLDPLLCFRFNNLYNINSSSEGRPAGSADSKYHSGSLYCELSGALYLSAIGKH